MKSAASYINKFEVSYTYQNGACGRSFHPTFAAAWMAAAEDIELRTYKSATIYKIGDYTEPLAELDLLDLRKLTEKRANCYVCDELCAAPEGDEMPLCGTCEPPAPVLPEQNLEPWDGTIEESDPFAAVAEIQAGSKLDAAIARMPMQLISAANAVALRRMKGGR